MPILEAIRTTDCFIVDHEKTLTENYVPHTTCTTLDQVARFIKGTTTHFINIKFDDKRMNCRVFKDKLIGCISGAIDERLRREPTIVTCRVRIIYS